MKNRIKELLYSFGVSAVGVLRAQEFKDLHPILKKRGNVSLVEKDIEKRINPFLIMPDAKSIIVCLFSYHTKNKGNISSYAFGKDYHKVIEEKLKKASNLLEKSGYEALCFCDNSPLCDRFLAYRAGLGFVGKNGMLINEEIGSEFFIGYIITNCLIDSDKPLENTACIGCNRCINSCPGGALDEDFGFNENLCASFLTQKKGELAKEEKEIIKKSGFIWGCDICNTVCPYNQNAPITTIEEFKNDTIENLVIDDNISNREFREKFENRAFSWRGKNVILRNSKLFK